MVLEVMGRNAGWIALHAGISGGADCILIPEIPWTYENVCAKVHSRRAAGRNFTLIIVAEGAALARGQSWFAAKNVAVRIHVAPKIDKCVWVELVIASQSN